MNTVLVQKVKQDLRTLRLKDMAEALDAALEHAHGQSHLQFFSQLVQHQLTAVKARSLDRRVQKAQFPQNMRFDTFDWNFQPGLNVEQLKNLQDLNFVVNHQPLLILAKTGTGKTHIATALGITACEAGFNVQFHKLQNLLSRLYATLADDTTDDMISRFARLDLLIIDHVDHIRSKPEYPSLLLDLVSACHEKVSMIVTTRISFEEWAQALGNASITHAIIDRLLHRAPRSSISGPAAAIEPKDLTHHKSHIPTRIHPDYSHIPNAQQSFIVPQPTQNPAHSLMAQSTRYGFIPPNQTQKTIRISIHTRPSNG